MKSGPNGYDVDKASEFVENTIPHRYFPHIDGIRAIAVLPVVLFHLNPLWCPGGFVGVDVFFVISGYLITGGILKDLENNQFSLSKFYYRRCKRILPAYTLLVMTVLGIGLSLFASAKLNTLATTALYSACFSANIFFRYHSGYFDPAVQQNPLLHLWSLGVEEHFYLVIPILLACVWKIRSSAIKGFLLVTFSISLILSCLAVFGNQEASAFYFVHLRAWELLAGSLLATMGSRITSNHVPDKMLLLIGFVLVGGSYCLLSENMKFPGMSAVPVVLGTILLLRYGCQFQTWNILNMTPFVLVGKVSYSLYLWHWPVIAFWSYVRYGACDGTDRFGMAALSAILAWMSWRFVENPVRHSGYWTPIRALRYSIAAGLMLICTCAALLITRGFQGRLHPKADSILLQQEAQKVLSIGALVEPALKLQSDVRNNLPEWLSGRRIPGATPDSRPSRAVALGNIGSPATFLLCGDSHALVLSSSFGALAGEYGISGYYIPGARLLRNTEISDKTRIDHSLETENILKWLETNNKVKSVILACRWPLYSSGSVPIRQRYGKTSLDECSARTLENGIVQTAVELKRLGINFVVLSCVAQMPCPVSEVMAREYILPWKNPWPLVCSKEEYQISQLDIPDMLLRLSQSGYVQVVPMHQAFYCNNVYVSTRGDEILYSDNNHLTLSGAAIAVDYVFPFIRQQLNP